MDTARSMETTPTMNSKILFKRLTLLCSMEFSKVTRRYCTREFFDTEKNRSSPEERTIFLIRKIEI
jgi:hypothetical protein